MLARGLLWPNRLRRSLDCIASALAPATTTTTTTTTSSSSARGLANAAAAADGPAAAKPTPQQRPGGLQREGFGGKVSVPSLEQLQQPLLSDPAHVTARAYHIGWHIHIGQLTAYAARRHLPRLAGKDYVIIWLHPSPAPDAAARPSWRPFLAGGRDRLAAHHQSAPAAAAAAAAAAAPGASSGGAAAPGEGGVSLLVAFRYGSCVFLRNPQVPTLRDVTALRQLLLPDMLYRQRNPPAPHDREPPTAEPPPPPPPREEQQQQQQQQCAETDAVHQQHLQHLQLYFWPPVRRRWGPNHHQQQEQQQVVMQQQGAAVEAVRQRRQRAALHGALGGLQLLGVEFNRTLRQLTKDLLQAPQGAAAATGLAAPPKPTPAAADRLLARPSFGADGGAWPFLGGPLAAATTDHLGQEMEEYLLQVNPEATAAVAAAPDCLQLRVLDIGNTRVISSILAQSVALRWYHKSVHVSLERFRAWKARSQARSSSSGRWELQRLWEERDDLVLQQVLANAALVSSQARTTLEMVEPAWAYDAYNDAWRTMAAEFDLDQRLSTLMTKLAELEKEARFDVKARGTRRYLSLSKAVETLLMASVVIALYELYQAAMVYIRRCERRAEQDWLRAAQAEEERPAGAAASASAGSAAAPA